MFTRNKLLSHLLLVCLLLGAIPIALHVSSENVLAAPDIHTWDGGGADAFAETSSGYLLTSQVGGGA